MKTACLLLLLSGAMASDLESAANPIRKVVTMLQDMQNKVKAEGVKEEALHEKFMCYCKTSSGTLDGSIAEAEAKIEALTASLKADKEKKAQTEEDLKDHTESRAAAKDAMAKATAMRKKENTAFNQYKSDQDTNIDATNAAIVAIEKGMGGAFLQTKSANIVRVFAMEKAQMNDDTRQELLAFLSGSSSQGYAPASGEIVGILKEMADTMNKDLAEATATEKAGVQTYNGLIAAKTKEVNTLQKQIETEMKRTGELSMAIADQTNDLEETQDALGADQKFLLELKKGCATKTGEWEAICKTRAEELVALAETIKVLNDDDALELFKKTLPGASASLMQVQVSDKAMTTRALQILKAVPRSTQLDLVQMLLKAVPGASHAGVVADKKSTFAKVIGMIDEMIANLKKEQIEDETKKQYCNAQLDETEDKKKVLENSVSDSEKAIADMQGAIANLKDEIANLVAGIKALDKSVAEATSLRQDEHSDFEELISSDTSAKQILLWAKNRLNKFYNPKLYKAPPKKELSAEDTIVDSFGGAVLVQISAHAAPPPPPETFGPYARKSEQGNGVIAMIDLLVGDLEKEMQTAKVDEENAQEEYETLMADSAAKRKADSELLLQKKSEKASTEEALTAEKETKGDLTKDLLATAEYLGSLHAECDWLLKFFSVRKEARAGEIDALGKAKAVLSGADYSFLQKSGAFLGRSH